MICVVTDCKGFGWWCIELSLLSSLEKLGKALHNRPNWTGTPPWGWEQIWIQNNVFLFIEYQIMDKFQETSNTNKSAWDLDWGIQCKLNQWKVEIFTLQGHKDLLSSQVYTVKWPPHVQSYIWKAKFSKPVFSGIKDHWTKGQAVCLYFLSTLHRSHFHSPLWPTSHVFYL